jgi:hypothetical protein
MVVSAGLLGLLVLLTWNSGRSGAASLLTSHASITYQLASANSAVRLDPGNAEAHYVRAALLEPNDLTAATIEYSRAAFARPNDYVLWLGLARAQELKGERNAAIAAAREAIPLAPDYAEPHYQLGNILVRGGQLDEGFKELRVAGVSNPQLLRGAIDLAWHLSKGNAKFVEQAVANGDPEVYQALFSYFREHQQLDAAIAMYPLAASRSTADERNLFLGDLIAARRTKDAAALWGSGKKIELKTGVLLDPGFEEESDLKDVFGWRRNPETKGFRLSLDPNNPREGRSSLKVEFDGESNFAAPVISQLLLVEGGASYQLRFWVRSEALVSGGLPKVFVVDADQKNVVSQTETFPSNTDNGWREYSIDFVTAQSTNAIRIALQRQACNTSPCPIFGRVWLDNFSLKKL